MAGVYTRPSHLTGTIRIFTLLEDDCLAMDMALAKADNSADQDLSDASDPFLQYCSMIQQVSSLKTTKEDAQVQAEKIEQLHTLLTLQHGDSPQTEVLKNSALYYRRLVCEAVSNYGNCSMLYIMIIITTYSTGQES